MTGIFFIKINGEELDEKTLPPELREHLAPGGAFESISAGILLDHLVPRMKRDDEITIECELED
jgi:hypothetical protein